MAAPTAPVLLAALILMLGFGGASPEGFQVIFLVFFVYGGLLAYIATLLIGVPAYLLLRRRMELGAGSGAVAGALVASGAAVLLLGGLVLARGTPPAQWWPLLPISAVIAAPGAFGGWVFWRVLTGGRRGRG